MNLPENFKSSILLGTYVSLNTNNPKGLVYVDTNVIKTPTELAYYLSAITHAYLAFVPDKFQIECLKLIKSKFNEKVDNNEGAGTQYEDSSYI